MSLACDVLAAVMLPVLMMILCAGVLYVVCNVLVNEPLVRIR